MKQQVSPTLKRIPFTPSGYQKILDEKSQLLRERPEAVEHLRKAREMGDLSENGYYKASRAKLSSIDARLRHLEKLIRLGKVVESALTGFVDIGSQVAISDGSKTVDYTIVGGYESDPKNKTVSFVSPIGKALMGKKVGDSVTVHAPIGDVIFKVISVK